MLSHVIKGSLLVVLGFGFTACQQYDNFVGRSGMECDNKEIISLTQNILNHQILKDGNLKVDTNNIVIWNYNKVGRYACRAKVSGLGDSEKINPFLLKIYGLKVDPKTDEISGWIRYDTYKTTKGDGYYVKINTIKD